MKSFLGFLNVVNLLVLEEFRISILLNTHEIPAFHQSRNEKRAAAASVVKDQVARPGICSHEISSQLHRLLCGMNDIPLALCGLEVHHVSRVSLAVTMHMYW